MQWSDVTFRAPVRILRQFAALCTIVLGLGGSLGVAREQFVLGATLIAAAVAIGGLGIFRPQSVAFLFGTAMLIAFPVGWVVSQVLLVVLFFGVFAPIGLLLRLCGRDSLRCRFDADATTYWEVRPAAGSPRRYFQQF